jgi:predicted DNA-binding protein (MmcQ/YjbR family)
LGRPCKVASYHHGPGCRKYGFSEGPRTARLRRSHASTLWLAEVSHGDRSHRLPSATVSQNPHASRPLKAFTLSLPHTTLINQSGYLVFKVAGKVFIIISVDGEIPGGISLKCTPEEFDVLIENDGFIQAPYCAKRHWVRLQDLTLLPEDKLQKLIRRSYDLVVAKLPKKVQATLR